MYKTKGANKYTVYIIMSKLTNLQNFSKITLTVI